MFVCEFGCVFHLKSRVFFSHKKGMKLFLKLEIVTLPFSNFPNKVIQSLLIRVHNHTLMKTCLH